MATVTREQELLSVIYKLTDALEQANGRLWKCGGESVTPEMTESERAALASPPAEDDIRAAIQGWALYCFKRHGNDAHLYNGLAALGGVDVDGKGWQAQAPPASDPPGLVTLVDKHIDGLRRAYSHDGIDVAMREMGKIRIEALEGFRDTLLPASPQAETKRDCTCLGSCRGAEGLSPRYRCVLASPQAETTKGDE